MNSSVSHFADGFNSFFADVITNADNANQRQISVIGIALSLCHGEESHGTSRLCINIGCKVIFLYQFLDFAFFVEIMRTFFDDFFRCTFYICNALSIPGNCHTGALFVRVKSIECFNILSTQIVYCVGIQQESHKGSIGAVTSDNLPIACHRTVVDANASNNVHRQGGFHLRKFGELLNITGGELNDRQTSFCDRSGLIAEKDAQAASGFETVDLSNKNIVLCHLHALEGEQNGSKHRQAFRNCAHDDRDGNRNCIHDQTDPFIDTMRNTASQKSFCHDSDYNADCANISKG